MKCRAVCGIQIRRTRFSEVEDVFKSDPHDFDAGSEQAAKSKCSRWVSGISQMRDIAGTVLIKMDGELPPWWDEDWKLEGKPKWEPWGKVKKETYQQNPNFIYAECYRHTRFDSVSLDSQKAYNVGAYLRLAWLEEEEKGI